MNDNEKPASNVREIDPNGERVAGLSDVMRKSIEHAIEDMGSELGGFAIVTWSMGGRCHTSYNANYGLVHRGMVPAMTSDALQRHIIVDMVDEGQPTSTIEPA